MDVDREYRNCCKPKTPEIKITGTNIHFAFDSFLLSDQARQILISKAEYLRTYPDITVTVEGHCDDRNNFV